MERAVAGALGCGHPCHCTHTEHSWVCLDTALNMSTLRVALVLKLELQALG